VNGGDGFIDNVFLRDLRSGTINFRGLVPVNQKRLWRRSIYGVVVIRIDRLSIGRPKGPLLV
jgi:hypothetical protein